MAKITDSPAEAEFREWAREWADYISRNAEALARLVLQRADDAVLDVASMARTDPGPLQEALRAALRPHLAALIEHQHYRDKYIIGAIFAAVGAGIKRRKARRIVGDVFKLDPPTIRKIDRARFGGKKRSARPRLTDHP